MDKSLGIISLCLYPAYSKDKTFLITYQSFAQNNKSKSILINE